jgi:hypothetical protein
VQVSGTVTDVLPEPNGPLLELRSSVLPPARAVYRNDARRKAEYLLSTLTLGRLGTILSQENLYSAGYVCVAWHTLLPVLGHQGLGRGIGSWLIEQGREQLLKRLGGREMRLAHSIAAEANEHRLAIH